MMKLYRMVFVASTGSMFAVAVFMPHLFLVAFVSWLVAGVLTVAK